MERKIEFYPAYDKRNPDPHKNYGIGSVKMKFILKGELGAVQFAILTGWTLKHVREEAKRKGWDDGLMAYGLGYHSPKPMYEEQMCMTDSCEYLDGKPCYYDGSILNAEPVLESLIEQGDEAVWKRLEEYYEYTFGELK